MRGLHRNKKPPRHQGGCCIVLYKYSMCSPSVINYLYLRVCMLNLRRCKEYLLENVHFMLTPFFIAKKTCRYLDGSSCLFRISHISLNSSMLSADPVYLLTTHCVIGIPGIPGANNLEFTFTYTQAHPQLPF